MTVVPKSTYHVIHASNTALVLECVLEQQGMYKSVGIRLPPSSVFCNRDYE